MRLLAACLVKNEADIICETLAEATRWCDLIYVHDTGSTDGTWDAVVDAASESDAIVPFRREDVPFDDNLRAATFELYLAEARPGDWWCPLDADEIYIDDPRAFLGAVPEKHGVVWSSCYEFMFTDRDLDRYREQPSEYAQRPVEERLRYYANTWSEPRFYRYRAGQRWEGRPSPAGRAHPRRIRYKHYQYRSPEQIRLRLDTRRAAIAAGHFAHERREHWAEYSPRAAELHARGDETPQTWEERVVDASTLHYDAGDGSYVADQAALPVIAHV
jgi:hypothetical protein